MLYIVTRLVDRGYGNNIEKVFNNANDTNSHFLPFYNYFTILYLRRTGKIKEAKNFYESVKSNGFDSSLFGKLKSSYEFIYTQVLHLLGNYNHVLRCYKQIIDDYALFGADKIEQRTLYLAKIKYADIMFLKGDFTGALESINKIDLTNLEESEIKMEVLRVKAHIFKFNYMFDKAIQIYNYVLNNKSETDLKIIGNIYTNLTEAYALIDPLKALEYAEKSLEINKVIKSNIEIGKALAAKAVALGISGKISEGIISADTAIEIQTQTGYKSGMLFGLISRLYLEYLNNGKNTIEYITKINSLFDELEVYNHLGLFINTVSGKETFKLNKINWLDYHLTTENLKKIL